ncbi:MAG: hypothetical protein IRZ23_05840 [Acetobacteraceae bacterium]|nr:hypothetical protein [Acetobacteraceae bacterium]
MELDYERTGGDPANDALQDDASGAWVDVGVGRRREAEQPNTYEAEPEPAMGHPFLLESSKFLLNQSVTKVQQLYASLS